MSITGIPGMDYYIMNSDYSADRVIALFESAAAQGYPPNAVEDEVFEQAGVNPADLTSFDRQRIQIKVNEIWETFCSGNRRNL